MTLTNGFDAGTNVGLLGQIVECLWIENPQQDADFGVFDEIEPISVNADAIRFDNVLAVDDVNQRGEALDDTVGWCWLFDSLHGTGTGVSPCSHVPGRTVSRQNKDGVYILDRES